MAFILVEIDLSDTPPGLPFIAGSPCSTPGGQCAPGKFSVTGPRALSQWVTIEAKGRFTQIDPCGNCQRAKPKGMSVIRTSLCCFPSSLHEGV